MLRRIDTRCNKIRLAADCPRSQIVKLAASKRGNSSLGLHQGTPRPSSASAFAHAGAACTGMRQQCAINILCRPELYIIRQRRIISILENYAAHAIAEKET